MGKPPSSGPYKGMGGFQMLGNMYINKQKYGTVKAPAGVKPLSVGGVVKGMAKQMKLNLGGPRARLSSGVNTEVQNDDVITAARAKL